MKLTRRQLFGAVVAVPLIASPIAGEVATLLQPPDPPTYLYGGWRQFYVGLEPLEKIRPFSQEHLERITFSAATVLRDRIAFEAKNKPLRFMELQPPPAVDMCRCFAFGPMRCREVWFWEPIDMRFVGRLDAVVQIG